MLNHSPPNAVSQQQSFRWLPLPLLAFLLLCALVACAPPDQEDAPRPYLAFVANQGSDSVAAVDLEKTFQARLERRRAEMILGGQAPLPGRQGTYTRSLIDRSRQLQSELVALREKRQRLEDSILAEVKIEVATIAQIRRLDVVLTRYVSNVTGVDITPDVVAKLKP